MTASSRRPCSQSISSEGGTTSASRRLARLRHLPPWPSTSHLATSRPASFNAATTFDPIKPAPPVTSNMPFPAMIVRQSFASLPRDRQRRILQESQVVDPALPVHKERLPTGLQTVSGISEDMNSSSQNEIRIEAADTRPILVVPYMWIGDF